MYELGMVVEFVIFFGVGVCCVCGIFNGFCLFYVD